MITPLVSIIVPVYNAKNTLERCIESIIFQEYKKIELILVNDGSTDNSLSVCQKYAREDGRILVINKDNSGVSDSRNRGIEKASGDYLQFVDSDDWITKNATWDLVKKAAAKQCDLVIANFYRVVNGREAEKGYIKNNQIIDRKKYLSYMMKEPANFYFGVMWNKLYRRDIVSAHGISCCTDLNVCEDYLFNLDYLRCAETIAALNKPIYYYVKTKNSLISKERSLNNIIRMKIKLFDAYKELFESMELYEEYRTQVKKFFIAYAKDSSVGYSFPWKGENPSNVIGLKNIKNKILSANKRADESKNIKTGTE